MPSGTQPANLNVQPGPRTCNPFILNVGVYSPEAGYKFEISVELACAPDNSPIWKLLFDLYKKQATGDAFDQLIHISFVSGTAAEQQALETMANDGVSDQQADALSGSVYKRVKDVATAPDPATADKHPLHEAISSAVTGIAPAPPDVSA